MAITLHDVYDHMTSLAYKIERSQDRVDRIRLQVARDQFETARRLPRSGGRGPRERRMRYWDEQWANAEARLGD